MWWQTAVAIYSSRLMNATFCSKWRPAPGGLCYDSSIDGTQHRKNSDGRSGCRWTLRHCWSSVARSRHCFCRLSRKGCGLWGTSVGHQRSLRLDFRWFPCGHQRSLGPEFIAFSTGHMQRQPATSTVTFRPFGHRPGGTQRAVAAMGWRWTNQSLQASTRPRSPSGSVAQRDNRKQAGRSAMKPAHHQREVPRPPGNPRRRPWPGSGSEARSVAAHWPVAPRGRPRAASLR